MRGAPAPCHRSRQPMSRGSLFRAARPGRGSSSRTQAGHRSAIHDDQLSQHGCVLGGREPVSHARDRFDHALRPHVNPVFFTYSRQAGFLSGPELDGSSVGDWPSRDWPSHGLPWRGDSSRLLRNAAKWQPQQLQFDRCLSSGLQSSPCEPELALRGGISLVGVFRVRLGGGPNDICPLTLSFCAWSPVPWDRVAAGTYA
jgi:hypothetical protein